RAFWVDEGQDAEKDTFSATKHHDAHAGENSLLTQLKQAKDKLLFDIPIPSPKKIKERIKNYLNKSTENTKFGILEDLFKKGLKPSKEDMTGWYSGKWCSSDNPDIEKGSIFIGQHEGDTGKEKLFKVGVHYCCIAPHLSCDNLTPKRINYYSELTLLRHEPESREKEFVFYNRTFDKKNRSIKQIRKYGNVLVVKEGYEKNIFGKYDTKYDIRYHYFYKDVTPQ
ncbi:MAG: hypothetical protein KAR84_03065, partial [Elusimicrobiales bacterium]|nr:hypothetical protein [Elusimicrobiales bacterium]